MEKQRGMEFGLWKMATTVMKQDGRMDGQMDGSTDRWMDSWMDGWIDR